MKEANMSFLASRSESVLNNITDFVKNHKPKITANKQANNESSNFPANPKMGNMDKGIKNKV